MADLSNIQALTFDVGGTVFDWRGTIEDELRRLAQVHGVELDVTRFATAWRTGMFAMLSRVRSRELPWMNADELHRRVLDNVLEEHPQLILAPTERDELTETWHRLRAWPGAPDAIAKLRSRYKLVVLTVLSWSIVVDCSKLNGIDWDGILSCEFLGDYKPDPGAYQASIDLLRLQPEQAMMVAAHSGDLAAAAAVGLRTAFVHREGESQIPTVSVDSRTEYDVCARDFPELADLLLR